MKSKKSSKYGFLRPVQTLLATYVFAKTVNLWFLIKKISHTCRTNILKASEDSLESKEHFRYIQNITEQQRKRMPKHVPKGGFSRKKVFWKCLRKSFLWTSVMLCRYLKCSSDSGLSFDYFIIILGHFFEVLLIRNEKLTVFAKRYVVKSVSKGLKKPYFEDFFDFKCL